MREGWEYKKLGDCCNVDYGTRVVQKKDGGTIYPVYGGGGETFRMDKYNREDCLIVARFAMSKTCVRYVPGKFFLNDSGLSVSAGYELLQSYLNHHILWLNDDIYNLGKGAAQRNLDVNSFKKISIAIPPLSIQESIVSELDEINNLLSLKRKELETYDKLAQSLFYEMFGDPVENEKGWEMKKLGEIAETTIGLTYKPENVSEDGIIVLRSGNIQDSALAFEDIVRVNTRIPQNKFVREGDILMCTRNGSFRLVGKVAMIQGLHEEMSYGAFMTIIRSNINPYLFGYFKTPAFRERLIHGKTTTVNQITVKMLNEIKLPIPPLPLQQIFAERIEAIEAQKVQVKAAIEKLERLLAARMQYWFD